jgi:hypothetical protein
VSTHSLIGVRMFAEWPTVYHFSEVTRTSPHSCACRYVIVPSATGPEAASTYMLRLFSAAPVVLQSIGRLSSQK